MKTALGILLSLGLAFTMMAQPAAPSPAGDFADHQDQWMPASRSAHETVWQSVVLQTNALGRVMERTNRYHELATGLNQYDEATQAWQPSREEWLVYPDGIVARAGRTKVILAHNLNLAGSVDVLLPDGVTRLISNPVSLGFYDPVDGKQTILAEVKDCAPQRGAAANEIVFRDCFDGIRGSIRYLYTRAGFHQHVVIEQRLELPEGFSDKSRLELYTEFAADTPSPRLEHRVLRREPNPVLRALMVEPDFTDAELSFGVEMAMRAGKAFSLGTESAETPERSIRVGKQMQTIDGKPVLIEAVEFRQIEPLLAGLTAVETAKTDRLAINTTRQINAPKQQARLSQERFGTERTGDEIQLASQPVREPAVVIDYELLGSTANFTFKGDTTYYVSSPVFLSGATIIEGGTVVKSAVTQCAGIVMGDWDGTVVCKTGPYRPAVFTSKHDNSVGQPIGGSSGNPARGDYAAALAVQFEWASVGLHDLRIAHATTGLQLDGYGGAACDYRLTDIQILRCDTGIAFGGNLYLGNALIYEVESEAIHALGSDSQIVAEHITAHNPSANGALFTGQTGDNFNFHLRNSLLSGLSGSVAPVNLSEASYSVPPSTFQTVGAGACYLADNTYRNVGTTAIDPDLAAALKQKTTYPPVVINSPLTADTSWVQQAPRDTDQPDRGYHYDPLDYLMAGISVRGVTLTIGSGVAVGFDSAVYNWGGLVLESGATIVSHGKPDAMNRLAWYNTVQEQPTTGWPSGYMLPIIAFGDVSPVTLDCRFTEFSRLSGWGEHIGIGDVGAAGNITLRDTQFYNGQAFFHAVDALEVNLRNCLFARTPVSIWSGTTEILSTTADNNLFWNTALALGEASQHTAEFYFADNLFFNTAISQDSGLWLTHDYNGYLQNQPRLSPNGANDVIVASLAFETGTLGGFYQPANSALADKGSRSAASAGLHHYTTTRDQVAEQNSTVDIGFHYVAMEPGRLVGHWRFDEESGTLATDDSGYGNDGTRVNGPVAASSKIGAHSLSLDGVNDYVIVQNASVLEVGQNNADFSVFFWIYLTADATGSFRNVFHKGTDPARTFAIWLFPTDNRLHYRISTTANSNEGGNSVGALPLNQWVQVAYVKTGNKLRLYLDGALDSQATLTAPSVSNTGPLYIGKDPLWAGTQCRIDEVRVYNQALAAAGTWLAWDTDADGLPDYLEDTNGDGVYNSGDLADFTNRDTDGDGLPDWWEIRYFGNHAQTPSGDPDGDGLTNLEEYELGTDPTKTELTINAHKNYGEDRFEVEITNLSGKDLAGGSFDLLVYFDGQNRTHFAALHPWGAGDSLPNNGSRGFWFCTPDHSVLNSNCIVLFQGENDTVASHTFDITSQDGQVRVIENTTQIASPNIEDCENWPPTPISPPPSRPSHDFALPGEPYDQWPAPPCFPASSSVGDANQVLDDFYKPSEPEEFVLLNSDPKRGFKNVYAIKQWHGVWGFNSPMRGDWPAAFNGDGTCQRPQIRNTPATTKYRTVSAHCCYEARRTVEGVTTIQSQGTVARSNSVGQYTGKLAPTGSDTDYFGGTIEASKLLGVGQGGLGHELFGRYCAALATSSYAGRPVSYSSSGPDAWAATITLDDNLTATISVDLSAGTFSWVHNANPYWGTGWTEHLSISDTMVVYSKTNIEHDHFDFDTTVWSASVSLTNDYTSTMLNQDVDDLLASWNLLDDNQYPWRTDGGITRGPLVTYNELGMTAPDINFALENGQPPVDDSPLPWPSQPPGEILGAPLPVGSEPYFNFYHLNWYFKDTERGNQGSIASRGATSPFPHATQWLDDDQARVFPGGPFWAYGSAVEADDHLLFRLKNPYITDTTGEWEQGGYGAFLIKCKWAETIDAPALEGNDFIFKEWKFNFRDFIENYHWNSRAWYRNEIEIPWQLEHNAMYDPDIPVCGALNLATPVRYTPFIIDPPEPGAGYYIGPGSYWISEMNCHPLHYDYNCCKPAVFVQPNDPGDCNGVFIQMPPAVADELYGSLWMGRVDQTTSDASACQNYVANRNAGLPNPPACDPQIALDLVFHPRFDWQGNLIGGQYELFVAPLGFSPGGVPPRLDLDIDSDNNDGFGAPKRTEMEDLIEDDPARPGKYVWLNEDDWDADDIPDFADGFNLNGIPGDADDVIENWEGEVKRFVKLVLELPAGTDLSHATLNLGYSASSPAAVTCVGDPPEWSPGPGKLRIWRRDASEPRNGNSVKAAANPGDYVEPGVYTDLSQLGFSAGQHTVTYFVEGIAPIVSLGHPDFRITVSLDPDGAGPAAPLEDAVRVTVIPNPEIIPDTEADVSADDRLIHVVCELGENGGAVGGVSTDGSELEWRIALKSENETGGWLSSTTTQFADGLTATTLHTSTLPGTTYRLAARLRSYAGVNLGDYGPWTYSAVIVVVPGKPHSIALTPSKFSYHSDGTDTVTIKAEMWDQYGNPVADDAPVVWGVNQNPDPPFVSAETSTKGGKAVAVLRAPIIPENQDVTFQAGEAEATTTILVDRVTGWIGGDVNLDVGGQQTAIITANVQAADGTPVYWTTSNGEITSESIVNAGTASATLSASRGRLGAVVVTATIGDRLLFLEGEFTSSSGLALGADHPVLIGDASSDGVRTRTFDHGITRQIPYYAASPVRIKGPANALVQLTIEGSAPVAAWAFDTATGNVTPSTVGVHDMTLSGAVLDEEISFAGASSLQFDGAGTGTVADDPHLDFTDQFNASVWIRPGEHSVATIAAKAGAWEISQLADGRIQASVTTGSGTFTATTMSALPLNQWTDLQVDFRFNRLQVFTNNSLAAQAATTGSLVVNGNPILVGTGFTGHLDTLTLRSGMNLDPFITTSGLGAGNTVQLDANGTGNSTIASRGTATSAFVIRIRGQTNPEGEMQMPVVPHDWWDYTWDGVASFFGADSQTHVGTVTSIAGGFLLVADIGSLIKNYWRAIGGSTTPVNRLECVLGGVGILTTFTIPTGGGAGVDVALSTCRTLAMRLGPDGARFISIFVQQIRNVVIRGQKLPDGTVPFLQKMVNDPSVATVFNRIIGDEALQKAAVGAAHKLGPRAESFYQGARRAATEHSDDVARRMVQTFDGLGDDVLDVLKNTPAAQLDEAMDGLAAVLKNGVDPGVIKNALNSAGNFGNAYKQAELLIDLKLLADVPGLNHCLAMMKNATTKGFRYEIEGTAALKRQGMDIIEMSRRVANRVGRTDIDVVVNDGGKMVYYQFKRSPEALGYGKSGLKKTRAWVWKALKDLGLRGQQAGFDKVRYAVPGTGNPPTIAITIPPRIQKWLASRVPPVRIDPIQHLD